MTELRAYLDYNATAPVRPEVIEAMRAQLGRTGNPSSVHGAGRLAHRVLESARAALADLVGAKPETVVFTSGGTEANNLALAGLAPKIGRIVISAIEHPSVSRPAEALGLPLFRVPVTSAGVIDLQRLEEILAESATTALISIMLANNETGVIQPAAEIARLARRFGAIFHCDAVQAIGKMPVDKSAIGADLLTLSGHKFGGPQGVGALILDDDMEIAARLLGGAQERYRRAGTENLPGIAGLGVAAVMARSSADVEGLRDRLEAAVREIAADAVLFGQGAPRLGNTSCIAMPGVSAETQVIALDLAGIAVSSGAACSSGKVHRSQVLEAMGAGDLAGDAIRVSLGWASQPADIERFIEAWRALYLRTSRRRDARAAGTDS